MIVCSDMDVLGVISDTFFDLILINETKFIQYYDTI